MQILSEITSLNALSPLDGRYAKKSAALRPFLCESAFMAHRVEVEIAWLIALSDARLSELLPFSDEARSYLQQLVQNFCESDASRIKEIEQLTNHDVKAVEYWLKEKVAQNIELNAAKEFIHFACTSEDINNTAHALMLKRVCAEVIIPRLSNLCNVLFKLTQAHAKQPMLARTHGQPASPTTLGKEFANVAVRLQQSLHTIQAIEPLAKLNGATGNYNAHVIAYPEIDWPVFSKQVLATLGLTQNPYTIQIEPHDWMASLFDAIARANLILLDLCRDIWGYIALGYFKQRLKEGEIGSSTMPHKVNPIDFENAEGNLGLANAMLRHLSDKLPISRWQRDLSDSTVLRNLGVALGYSLIAWESCLKGLAKLEVNTAVINHDIDHCWEILAEPIQTVMRRYHLPEPYEQLKNLTRGKEISESSLRAFILALDLPQEAKARLMALKPRDYVGLAVELAYQAAY